MTNRTIEHKGILISSILTFVLKTGKLVEGENIARITKMPIFMVRIVETVFCRKEGRKEKGKKGNNTITDGGVAPRCSFIGPTENPKNTETHRKHRYKKRTGRQKREDRRPNAKRTERRPSRLRRSGRDLTAALISTNNLLFNIGWNWSVLGGFGSILGSTGQYLVVMGHYWVVLASTWWYWVNIGWYWSLLGSTGS